jgi:hypothetical protein
MGSKGFKFAQINQETYQSHKKIDYTLINFIKKKLNIGGDTVNNNESSAVYKDHISYLSIKTDEL